MSRIVSALRALRDRVSASTCCRTTVRGDDAERGDVPGWVLVTLMTAGLVTLLWQTAGPLLQSMFTSAMNKVSGG